MLREKIKRCDIFLNCWRKNRFLKYFEILSPNHHSNAPHANKKNKKNRNKGFTLPIFKPERSIHIIAAEQQRHFLAFLDVRTQTLKGLQKFAAKVKCAYTAREIRSSVLKVETSKLLK